MGNILFNWEQVLKSIRMLFSKRIFNHVIEQAGRKFTKNLLEHALIILYVNIYVYKQNYSLHMRLHDGNNYASSCFCANQADVTKVCNSIHANHSKLLKIILKYENVLVSEVRKIIVNRLF